MMGFPAITLFEIFVFFKQQRGRPYPYQITYINWGLGFIENNITLHLCHFYGHEGIKHISQSSADNNH
jgi:hypothetical protein